MMEQEIDLRPYLQAVLRQWRLIGLAAACTALVAAVIVSLMPPVAEVRALVLIEPVSPQLSLDPRFAERTVQLSTPAVQRQAVLDLAESPILEAHAIERLGGDLEPGSLLSRISVEASSDLMTITATAADEAEAALLAESWGQSYEALVAEVYRRGGSSEQQLVVELDEARTRHEAARQALESFLREGELVRAEQNVIRLQGLLKTSVDAQQGYYTAHLSRTQQIDTLLADVRSLQAQVELGDNTSPSDTLGALLLKVRATAGETLPVDLSISDLAGGPSSAETLLTELGRLETALESERERMLDEAVRLAAGIASGDSLDIDAATRAGYEADLAAARGALARLEAERGALEQNVTIALNTVAVLQTKSDEEAISQVSANVNVRYLGTGIVPQRSPMANMVLGGAVAALLVAFLGVFFVIAREGVRQVAPAASRRPPVERTPEPSTASRSSRP